MKAVRLQLESFMQVSVGISSTSYNSSTASITRAQEISKCWGVKCEAYKVDVMKHKGMEAADGKPVGVLGGFLMCLRRMPVRAIS